MRTGQISRQAPQRLLACGSSPNATEPAQGRREHRAHGTHVDGAVRVPADRLIDGADVQAGAAPDAVEDLRELGAEQPAAPVVHEHDVQLVGAVRLRARRVGGAVDPAEPGPPVFGCRNPAARAIAVAGPR